MNDWQIEFQNRMKEFGADVGAEGPIVSFKIRAVTGCYCRGCCPAAHQELDRYLKEHPFDARYFQYLEHESGPELLIYIGAATAATVMLTAGINLVKSVVDLATTVVKARADGRKQGDRKPEPLVIIVRTIDGAGAYRECEILQVDTLAPPTPKAIEKAVTEEFEKIAAAWISDKPPRT